MVDTYQIEETVGLLRELSTEKVEERNTLKTDIDDLETRRSSLREDQRQREHLQHRLNQITSEIEDRTARIEDLQAKRQALTTEVEKLEEEVDVVKGEDYSDILDLHKEANQLEFELGELENELEDVGNEITAIEEQLVEREQVETRRDELQAEIETLRTQIERIEGRAIEQFNDHMETVLDLLEYANVERIWIERIERDMREGRSTGTGGMFELHVVRGTDSGTVYEDSVDHLSESERDVTGLVFALAGYLAHEVYDISPVMLLDSLEALDTQRIATLVDYLKDYTEYLIVAILSEDAEALSDDYPRVGNIGIH